MKPMTKLLKFGQKRSEYPPTESSDSGKMIIFGNMEAVPAALALRYILTGVRKTVAGSHLALLAATATDFVEFWNLVFSQFDSDGNGTYTPLEKPNIDTGMGLERLACIMQGVDNLFEVDTIQNIMNHVARIANVKYKEDEKTDVSLRVITDHIRSTTFMSLTVFCRKTKAGAMCSEDF